MSRFRLSLYAFVFGIAMTSPAFADDHECALNFKVKSIDGQTVDLEDYKGQVVLVVNVASECGLTPQYAGLQKLYDQYKDKGFVILAFPCNQFGSQEPGSEAEIKQFCSTKYNVNFPLFSKIDVNGENAAPIYQYLTSKDAKPVGSGKISWNFEKFLIDRKGQIAGRFSPRTTPSDAELVKAIEAELGKG
ncbi:MAG: glutathione peroxidase [Planctomycetaceae bacterium]